MKDIFKQSIKFLNDDTVYFAASLSFFTIFSLLPIIALIVVVMSSTTIFTSQMELLMSYVYDFVNPTHSQEIISIIQNSLENINKLGNIGIVYLLFVFTMFFKDYEYIVCKIHKTKRRAFLSLSLLYISFLIILPFSLLFFIFIKSILVYEYFTLMLNFLASVFILTYMFKISIKKYVSLKASFISATLTVLALKLTQVLFVYYIFYNTTYTSIYGTLSVMLFMFLWIYVSWIVYLYGVKLCYKLNMENIQYDK